MKINLVTKKKFIEATYDNLKQDLDALEGWGNFLTIQDTNKTKTLEEFKNRKFRYQISPNTIELERMLIKLENMKETSTSFIHLKQNNCLKLRNFLYSRKVL